jgi:Transglycosylase SLT domain
MDLPRGAALGLAAVTLAVTALGPASPAGASAVPAGYLVWYRAAARTCPGLTWEVLAGIGTMESGNGQSSARGVHRGKNRAGAEGPMQFEPATFAEYAVRADPAVKLTPYNPEDAIFTAARMLCVNGGGSARRLKGAIFAYNHARWYVRDVLAIAARYTAAATGPARHPELRHRGVRHRGVRHPEVRHRGVRHPEPRHPEPPHRGRPHRGGHHRRG